MKLLAHAPAACPKFKRIKHRPGCTVLRKSTVKRRPIGRFMICEDLEYFRCTGETRWVIELRWTI